MTALNFTSSDSRINEPLTRWFWTIWTVAMSAILVVHLSTIEVAPFLHKDEFLIVDLGRIVLQPDTDWSIAWMTAYNQPLYFVFYLGPVLQEGVFSLAGEYGPRISSLLGGMVAATIMVKWLLAKGTTQATSLILGLVFLLDPMFVEAYALGRVDSWMIAACLGSCWILACTNTTPEASNLNLKVALSGALLALGFFLWPTAVFFIPLVALELYVALSNRVGPGIKNTATSLTCFAGGGVIACVAIMVPVASQFYANLVSIEGMKTNVGVGITKSGTQLVQYAFDQLISIFRFLKFTPVLLIVAAIYALRLRQLGLILALVTVAILMTFTKVYVHRAQYLLPYLIAAVAGIYPLAKASKGTTLVSRPLLVALLIWPVALSIGLRFFLAVDSSKERDRKLVYEAAEKMIGPGSLKVFSTYEFYYPGRSLGWHMYVPYDEVLSAESLAKVADHIDYAILPANELTREIHELLTNRGLQNKGVYDMYSGPKVEVSGQEHIRRVRNLFSIFRRPYGPYNLYAKEEPELVSRQPVK